MNTGDKTDAGIESTARQQVTARKNESQHGAAVSRAGEASDRSPRRRIQRRQFRGGRASHGGEVAAGKDDPATQGDGPDQAVAVAVEGIEGEARAHRHGRNISAGGGDAADADGGQGATKKEAVGGGLELHGAHAGVGVDGGGKGCINSPGGDVHPRQVRLREAGETRERATQVQVGSIDRQTGDVAGQHPRIEGCIDGFGRSIHHAQTSSGEPTQGGEVAADDKGGPHELKSGDAAADVHAHRKSGIDAAIRVDVGQPLHRGRTNQGEGASEKHAPRSVGDEGVDDAAFHRGPGVDELSGVACARQADVDARARAGTEVAQRATDVEKVCAFRESADRDAGAAVAFCGPKFGAGHRRRATAGGTRGAKNQTCEVEGSARAAKFPTGGRRRLHRRTAADAGVGEFLPIAKQSRRRRQHHAAAVCAVERSGVGIADGVVPRRIHGIRHRTDARVAAGKTVRKK